jgi:hypothetical protein
MRVQNEPTKAVVSVVEMSEMVGLSKSRFYTLMDEGVFPKPVENAATKRPVFDFDTQKKVLEVRRTGIAADGRPVLFNRKLNKVRKPVHGRNSRPDSTQYGELTDSLKSLGLTTTNEAVASAITELYPNGTNGTDEGEVIRRVFLYLQSNGANK